MRKKRHSIPGAAPGLAPAPPQEAPAKVPIHALCYTPDALDEREAKTAGEVRDLRIPGGVTWVNVDGVSDPDVIGRIGSIFGLHPLALEDVFHIPPRPKVEFYDGNIFVVVQMFAPGAGLDGEQVSIFLGADYVITFQENPGDVFDPVRERIRAPGSLLRKSKADFLAYALLDAILDNYFPFLDRFSDDLEAIEEQVVDNPDPAVARRIHGLKRDLSMMRRVIWPERDVVSTLIRSDAPLISAETRVYLRDCYDHIIGAFDMVETYRELASGVLDIYMTSVSNRMNQIMKLLTIIATIFIPLTFIVGLYGMNFNTSVPGNMPELNLPYAYPVCVASMAAVAVFMLVYFRRKGWL